MRNTKIFIAVGVLVILAGGAALLSIPTKKSDTPKTEQSTDYNVVISEKEDNIQKIICSIGTTDITFVNDNGDWYIDGTPADMTSQSKIFGFVSSSLSVMADSVIAENTDDFAEYGLDEPTMHIEYISADGNKKLLIGQKSPSLGKYFVAVENDNTVYAVSEDLYNNLNHMLDYYKEFNRISINTDNVTDIYMNRSDEGEMHVFVKDITSKRNYNVWQISEPYNGTMSAIDDYIDENLLAPISQLEFSIPDEDYQYNRTSILAHVEITETYQDNNTKYQFDVIDRNSTTAHVNYNGVVFTVEPSSVDFVFTNPFYVVSKLQAFVDIADVDSVYVESTDGHKYEIEIIRNGDNDFGYKINGVELSKTNGQRAYQAIIGMTADDEYTGEALLSEDIKISFKGSGDAEDVNITLSSIDDLSYAVTRGGNTLFTIKKSKITEMFNEIEAAVNA